MEGTGEQQLSVAMRLSEGQVIESTREANLGLKQTLCRETETHSLNEQRAVWPIVCAEDF